MILTQQELCRWLHKRGDFWHYRFTMNGKDYSGSTRSTDFDTAKAIMEEARTQAILKRPPPRTIRRKGESNPNTLRRMKLRMAECRCEVCGWGASRTTLNAIFGDKRTTTIEMHHIVPVREGGTDAPSNLMALCPLCHLIADRLKNRDRETLTTRIIEIQIQLRPIKERVA